MCQKISERWEKSFRKLSIFLNQYKEWLDGKDIEFNIMCETFQESKSGGRPRKAFEDCSNKSKKRKVQHLLQSSSCSELAFAAEVAIRKEGKKDSANVIKELRTSSSKKGTEIKHLLSEENVMRTYSADEALALYVDCKLTTHSYKLIRKQALKLNHNLYPSYYSLKEAKMRCCPSEEFIKVTERSAEITVQALLNLTVQRLFSAQEVVVKRFLSLGIKNFTLVSKWGCDGSSGHSRYKQKISDDYCDDQYLFLFSFVPLKLHSNDDAQQCAWQNARTSSTRFCRPIKFLLCKETDEMTNYETRLIQDEISNLEATVVMVENTQITVNHQMLLTMVDGKICNSLCENRSSQTCYICGATPKNMNVVSTEFREPKTHHYSFGLSTLHSWIRCFECLIHISYRLDIKKWQAKTEFEKTSVSQRKMQIQKRFKSEMGLIIDQPKPGFGSTNDGNTARTFFKNSQKSAEITGLDETLIKKFSVFLQTMSSGYEINILEFEKFVQETRELYLSLYMWYYMPVTVHKILVHGSEIIKNSIVPIGQLSEEAQEARNKDCRRFREHHTRKCSRVSTNKDLLTMLLITSDPVIEAFRDSPQKSAGSLSAEVLKLLQNPLPPSQPSRCKENMDINISDSDSE